MADLAAIRKAHPEYNDMSDQQLADALYAKFYSDMPREEFDARMTSPALGPSYGPGDSGRAPEAGLPVTPAQEREMRARGGVNTATPLGSTPNPRYQTPFSGAPDTGAYVPLEGGMVQTDAEPISKTLLALGARTFGPRVLPSGRPNPVAQSNTLDAARSGFTSALLLGGKNEIGAAAGAIPELVTGGLDAARGDFTSTLQRLDAQDRVLRENHPFAYYSGGVGGLAATAAVTPTIRGGGMVASALRGAGASARAADLGATVGGNAAINSVLGAAGGYLSTDGTSEDRSRNAVVGGILGGLAGGVGGRFADGPAPAARQIPTPEVQQAFEGIPESDLTRGLAYARKQFGGLDPAQMPPANPEMMAGEVAGPRGKAALGALARREGDTGAALEGRLGVRALDRPQRMMDAFEKATGVSPEAASGDIEALVKKGREAAGPLYDKAYSRPTAPQSDALDALMRRPSTEKALQRAARIAREEGRDPTALGFELDAEGNVVRIREPSVQTYDYIKRGLDDVLESYRDPMTRRLNLNTEGRAVAATADSLRAELKRLSPDYAKALDHSADYLSAQDAFRTAQKNLFSPRITAAREEARLAQMTPSLRAASRAGAANAIFDLAQNGRLKPHALKSPIIRDKLRALLGPDGADMISNMVKDEDAMRAFEQRYAPGAGSITSDITLAAKEQDSIHPFLKSAIDAGVATAIAGPKGGAASIVRDLASNVGDRLKGAGLSVSARDAAGRALMLPPEQFTNALASAPIPKRPVLNALRRAAHSSLTRSGRTAGILAGQVN